MDARTSQAADAKGDAASPRTLRAHELEIAPTRHPSWWVFSTVLLILLAMFVNLLVTNPNLQWDVVWKYSFHESILRGLGMTLWLTTVSMTLGIVIGLVLAIMRLSRNPFFSGVSWVYIWFFRGTPLLVQIIFWYNLSLLVPVISIGIPFFGPSFVIGDTNTIISVFTAAVLALSLNQGAYMAEIVRAGIISVDRGQIEAAQAIGLSRSETRRWIVLPQAMRVIIPPAANEVISMLKTTSLVSVIAFPDLLRSAQDIYSRTFETIPLLILASLWYLLVSTILTIAQYYIERHYARGGNRELPLTPLQKVRLKLRNYWPEGTGDAEGRSLPHVGSR